MRIFITGIGIVSPVGRGAAATMDALLAGRRGFGPVTLFDTAGCRSSVAAQVPGLAVEEVAPPGAADGWSRTDAMAVLAAREALAQAGLDPRRDRVDLVLGGTTAGMLETEGLLAEMHRDPAARRPLAAMLSHPLSATIDRLQQAVAPFARARTVSSACSSGANALLLGAAWLTTGKSRHVLCGGADGLCRLTYSGFSCLGALSPEPCRPFDKNRDGMSLGEGAAFLLIETEEAARERGAAPIAELRGWAVAGEAHHITNPEASGTTAARVIASAIARAGIGAADVDYVNAHGTATRLNDQMEACALARALGDEVRRVPVSSTKGHVGHTLGAAGAIEAAVAAMAIARGAMPPTAGLEEIDPECALVHLQSAREGKVRAAVSSSFGFGGSDTALVIAEPGRFPELGAVAPRRVVVSAAAAVGPRGVSGTRDTDVYLEPGTVGPAAFEAKDHLDLERARRLDRAGRLCAGVIQAALRESGATDLERAGAILGAAFGSIDACAAFVHRLIEKGAKLASPAVFPNLLPSSPVAQAAIYHGLRGPVLSSADLGATAEGSIVTAAELVAAGEAELMLAGGVEETSVLTEAVLEPLYHSARGNGANGNGRGARGEGAAVLALEPATAALARGAAIVAEISWWTAWRGEPSRPLASAPPPSGRSVALAARDDAAFRAAIAGSAWTDVPLQCSVQGAGEHECAGGFAAAAAVARLAKGEIDRALVLGVAPDRGYAFVLARGQEP
jgi:3-oxoacyl-[acyl-carrier-protein] synthase II